MWGRVLELKVRYVHLPSGDACRGCRGVCGPRMLYNPECQDGWHLILGFDSPHTTFFLRGKLFCLLFFKYIWQNIRKLCLLLRVASEICFFSGMWVWKKTCWTYRQEAFMEKFYFSLYFLGAWPVNSLTFLHSSPSVCHSHMECWQKKVQTHGEIS